MRPYLNLECGRKSFPFFFFSVFFNFDADAIKIAVFTTLAWTTTMVLINILPRISTLILLTINAVIFIILPIANYVIMLMAVRHHNRKVQGMVSSQQLRGILRREKKVAMNMFIVSVVLVVCVIPKLAVRRLSKSSLGSHYNSFSLWSTTLFLLNSSINPILYTWQDSRLRAALRSVINIWEQSQANGPMLL